MKPFSQPRTTRLKEMEILLPLSPGPFNAVRKPFQRRVEQYSRLTTACIRQKSDWIALFLLRRRRNGVASKAPPAAARERARPAQSDFGRMNSLVMEMYTLQRVRGACAPGAILV